MADICNIIAFQLLSHVQLFVAPWTATHLASLSFTISQSLLKLLSIELVMSSNHLVLCCPLLLMASIFASIKGFSNESAPHVRLPNKVLDLWLHHKFSNKYSGLISFKIDWFALLVIQGTLESLLQQHSTKASFLDCSAFFMVQLLHQYMTTGKTIALTRWNYCCHAYLSYMQRTSWKMLVQDWQEKYQ